jgi:hypothetical protein
VVKERKEKPQKRLENARFFALHAIQGLKQGFWSTSALPRAWFDPYYLRNFREKGATQRESFPIGANWNSA